MATKKKTKKAAPPVDLDTAEMNCPGCAEWQKVVNRLQDRIADLESRLLGASRPADRRYARD